MALPNALMTDLYQLTMAAGYFHHGIHEKRVSFELSVRTLPPVRRYMVFAGLEQVVETLQELRFTESQIAYLRQVPALLSGFGFEFIEYLRDFRFRGDLWAMPEGTVCFAGEPLLRVTGGLLEAQLVETLILSAINTATMVASKASRVAEAAGDAEVLEFGSRRTSPEEAVQSARCAYLAGFAATSNVEAGYRYDIPLAGTAAHSWTMSHATELDAFRHYVEVFPKTAILLVDTYDTLTGTRRAIEAAGDRLAGVRLDSGDLDALSRSVRELLDGANLPGAKIVASGDLEEHQIARLRDSGAPIDLYGVGTDVVRSRDQPALGGVYKLVYDHSEDRPVAKFSAGKGTLPGVHQVFRIYRDGRAAHDVVGTLPEFHVDSEPLLRCWLRDGKRVEPAPTLARIRRHRREQLARMPDSVRLLSAASPESPAYPVRISDALQTLLDEVRSREVKA